jgi:hypothetical protein
MNYAELNNAIQTYTENYESSFVANIALFVGQAEERIYNTVQLPALRRNVTGNVTAANPYLTTPPDFLAVYSMAVILPSGEYKYLLNKDVNFIRQAYPSPADQGEPAHYGLFDANTFILGPTPDINYQVELHQYYYPTSIVQSPIGLFNNVIVPGSGYTNGTYNNIALTGGTGSGSTANIVVTGGAVTSLTLVSGGQFYVAGDVISADIPGGTGFTATVSSVVNVTGTSWLGDNFETVLLYGALVEAYTFMKGEQDMITLYNQKYMEALALLKRLGDGMERQDAYRSGQYRQAVT